MGGILSHDQEHSVERRTLERYPMSLGRSKTNTTKKQVLKRTLLVLAGLLMVFVVGERRSFSSTQHSVEYGYVSSSPLGLESGLAVPASCPSDLHDDPNYGLPCSVCNSCGECATGVFQCGGACSAVAPSTCSGETAGACGDGSTNLYWFGALDCSKAEPVLASCPVGTRVYTQTTTTIRTCSLPSTYGYTGVLSRCEADTSCVSTKNPPVVNLTLNGSDGPVTGTLGSNGTLQWNVTDADTCVASGLWAGDKPPQSSSEGVTLFASGEYVLTCTGPGGSSFDRVILTLSCVATCSGWTACAPPCVNGNGVQTQTCTRSDCTSGPISRACSTSACRDTTWREIGQ